MTIARLSMTIDPRSLTRSSSIVRPLGKHIGFDFEAGKSCTSFSGIVIRDGCKLDLHCTLAIAL